jgi:hypothetical protein
VKHRNNDTDDRGNQRADSNVESPARVIKPLFSSSYLLNLLFISLNFFFSEPFPDELLLGSPPVTSEPRLLMFHHLEIRRIVLSSNPKVPWTWHGER